MTSYRKAIMPTVAILGVIASVFSILFIPSTYEYDVAVSRAISANPMWNATDPVHFEHDDYLKYDWGSFDISDPYTLRNHSDLIIIGQIVNKTLTYDYSPNATADGSPLPLITYDVLVSETKKGTYAKEIIRVVTTVRSNLTFETGDKILVMAMAYGDFDTVEPKSGPHGMFKIIDDNLIGHEITLPISDLLP